MLGTGMVVVGELEKTLRLRLEMSLSCSRVC
jgi:hypothetical protein